MPIITTPDEKHSFLVREGSEPDAAVVREAWVENVYQMHPGDFNTSGVFIDIGANIGSVSVQVASWGRDRREAGDSELPPIRVIGYEPEPDNLRMLSENLARNGVEATIHNKAVSSSRGTAWITDGHGGSTLYSSVQPESHEVEVVRLIDVFADNKVDECDVLKIDTEGSEYAIIAGASLAELRRIKYLTMEFHTASDEVFGQMVATLAKVFNSHIIGSPERGGQYYGKRY